MANAGGAFFCVTLSSGNNETLPAASVHLLRVGITDAVNFADIVNDDTGQAPYKNAETGSTGRINGHRITPIDERDNSALFVAPYRVWRNDPRAEQEINHTYHCKRFD